MKKQYLYIINYPEYEKSLCNLEIKSLFNILPQEKCFVSDVSIEVSRSTYVKEGIKIIYEEDNILDIINDIKRDKLSYDLFKIVYVKSHKPNVPYKKRMELIKEMGIAINGNADIHEPEIVLALTRFNNKWIFGEYIKNNFLWHVQDDKPNSYSNSLSTRVARAVVNIAVGNDLSISLIDPCCGVGTVILEALSMGINACGSDINKQIVSRARDNLSFFGYNREIISFKDINDIKQTYDTCIIDIPYGLFTKTTYEAQKNIIYSARRISKKVIFITFENMSSLIKSAGFVIKDRGSVNKGKFKRYIEICN